MSENIESAFFELVKTGLSPVHGEGIMADGSFPDGVDWGEVYRLAEEQAVIGLVSAGLDWLKVQDSRFKIPQEWALQFIGQTLQIEQRNKAMNAFVADLIERLRRADIYAILVKGQGVAHCYEKPLWRSCGDVDLLLNDENYVKAKELLLPLGEIAEPEERAKKHFVMNIDGWAVELHGTLHSGLSARVDRGLDEIKEAMFYDGRVRSTIFQGSSSQVQVFLPKADEDAVYVFTHFLQHFYKGGIGLRQICDWCRLLYTCKESLNYGLLESRIKKMGLMSEWRAFGVFAVEYLGMPIEAMPFLSQDDCHNANLKKKAYRICKFIMEVGNFGHNRDMSYYVKYPYLVRKSISAWWRVKDMCRHAMIFPLDSLRFFPRIMWNGMVSAVRGE